MDAQQTQSQLTKRGNKKHPKRYLLIPTILLVASIIATIWALSNLGLIPSFLAIIISAFAAIFAVVFALLPLIPAGSRNTDNVEGKLEITEVGFTHNAELDVKIRNLSDDVIIINRITISILDDPHAWVLPVLRPTAHYKIPIDDLRLGKSRSKSISHFIDAHKADRFLIALETTRVFSVRLTLYYNKDNQISFDKKLWSSEDLSPKPGPEDLKRFLGLI
jgi:hypothetical protein